MIFRHITHDDLGCASYLIGDEKAGIAAVVDPRFETDEYLDLARYVGVSIEHVLETHNHAEPVSGHGRLAAGTGATIHVHRAARAVSTTFAGAPSPLRVGLRSQPIEGRTSICGAMQPR
ncbi:MAG: hypothetical protein M3022_17515 [Actinomycetota bacterium]|nr:hypothetical protein [Actinomycetota bacterium]